MGLKTRDSQFLEFESKKLTSLVDVAVRQQSTTESTSRGREKQEQDARPVLSSVSVSSEDVHGAFSAEYPPQGGDEP